MATELGGTERKYDYTYSSYSGCDIVASITIPEFSTRPLIVGELQTVSYSIHREVSPVRTLGRANPKGFTNGTRTVAGSLIFTVFDNNLVHKIVSLIKEGYTSGDKGALLDDIINERAKLYKDRMDDINAYSLMDEMPPFDITISFMNEYGNQSVLVIKGIVIVDEGQVMSIEDMITENTMSYMATDIQVLKSLGKAKYPETAPALAPKKSDTGLSSLVFSQGTLSPSFDPANTSYVLSLPEGTVTPPTMTAVARDSKSTVTAGTFAGVPGSTTVRVTGEDKTITMYNITATTVSTDASLSSLLVGETLVPGFNPSTYAYPVTIDYGTRAIPKVTGHPSNPKATVTIKRPFRLPGTALITVTAEDKTKKTYSVVMSLSDPNHIALLASLVPNKGRLDPEFDEATYSYNLFLPYGTSTLPSINGSAKNPKASTLVVQASSLSGSAKIDVTAQDGTTKNTYTCKLVVDPKPFTQVFSGKNSGDSVTVQGWVVSINEATGDAILADDMYTYNGTPATNNILVTKPAGFAYTIDTMVTVTGTYNGIASVQKGSDMVNIRKVTAATAS